MWFFSSSKYRYNSSDSKIVVPSMTIIMSCFISVIGATIIVVGTSVAIVGG